MSYCKAADERNTAERQRDALREALEECADELAGWVEHHYRGITHYPTQKLRYDRDMRPVLRARRLLSEP